MAGDIVRFKSEYKLEKDMLKEASSYQTKLYILLSAILTILLIPIPIIFDKPIALIPCFIPIALTIALYIIQNKKLDELYDDLLGQCKGRDVTIGVKLFNSKVAYSLRAGKKGLTQPIEFKYKDIKKFWKTKNLIVLQVKQGENSTILTMRKEHVDVEKITAFLKEKKNAK